MAKTAKRKLKASPQPNARLSAALAARKEFKREIALQREVSNLMRKLRRAVLATDSSMKDFLFWLSMRCGDITGVSEPPSAPPATE